MPRTETARGGCGGPLGGAPVCIWGARAAGSNGLGLDRANPVFAGRGPPRKVGRRPPGEEERTKPRRQRWRARTPHLGGGKRVRDVTFTALFRSSSKTS